MTATDLIKRFEGCKLEAYRDSVGVLTIGYGHTSGVREGMKISQEHADKLLDDDVDKFKRGVYDLLDGSRTTRNQFDAFVCLAFNIGLSAFGRSTALRLHKNGFHDKAADAILWWNKAGGKVLRGLMLRRQAEKELYETPDERLMFK